MAKFVVNGKEYDVPEEFTLGEMCDAEQHFGVVFGPNEKPSARVMAATLYISIRRKDPTVTVDDIRALSADDYDRVEDDADPPSPTPESDDSSSETSGSSGDSSKSDGESPDDSPNPTGPDS